MNKFAIGLISLFLLGASPASAAKVSLEDKVVLQATMSHYINMHTIDGIIPYVDLDSGNVTDLVPVKSHPMILSFGKKFVLCTDFRKIDGKPVNVDFYVSRLDKKFVIFQTEINNRDRLKILMKQGKVAMMK